MDKQEQQAGYKNPPKKTQAKKLPSMKVILQREMKKKITIEENNESRTVTKIEAIIAQLLNQAAEGNSKHLQVFLELLKNTNAMPLKDLDAHQKGLDPISLEKASKALFG